MITMVKALVKSSAYRVTITAMATDMGPVGPETCDLEPPKTEAKKPTATAAYNPGRGPSPLATPKANATGNPTTAAVTPPNRSPLKASRPYRFKKFMPRAIYKIAIASVYV